MRHIVILVFIIYLVNTATADPQTTATIAGPFVATTTTPALRHFQAVCLSDKVATLTVDGHFIIEGLGNCVPKEINYASTSTSTSPKKFNVSNDCLKGGEFIIKPEPKTNPGVSIQGGQGAKAYQMSCNVSGDGKIANYNASLIRVTPSGSSVSFTYTPPPLTVHLKVTGKTPTDQTPTGQLTGVKDAYIGQKLFLTIFHDQPGSMHLIPRICTAHDGEDERVKLTLWNLTSGKCNINCNQTILETADYMKDSGALTTCGTTTPAQPASTPATSLTGGRKRRDVMKRENSPSGSGNVHHVITTLHIRDDIMPTGSTSVIRHSVTYLIVPVLVKLFM